MSAQGLQSLRSEVNRRGLVVEHSLQDVDARSGVLVHKPLHDAKIQQLGKDGYKLTPAGPNYTAVWLP